MAVPDMPVGRHADVSSETRSGGGAAAVASTSVRWRTLPRTRSTRGTHGLDGQAGEVPQVLGGLLRRSDKLGYRTHPCGIG